MRATTAVFALLPIAVVLGDIDRALWRTPAEIDSSGSQEYVAERGSAVQQRSLEKYRREIAACDHRPPTEAIPILLRAVSKLPRYIIHQLRERIEVFDLARD